jgi:hypothetical protein
MRCGDLEGKKKCLQRFDRENNDGNLEEQGADGTIILKWILKN